MAKLKTMVGVTVGIFNGEGKLLLRRRKEHDSITDKDYYGCWELPVVAVQETEAESIPYDYLCRELIRGVKEETGAMFFIDMMPAFYPVMFKNPKGEYDLAMITPIEIVTKKPEGKEIIYVSPQELDALAEEYMPVKKDKEGRLIQEGKGLLSGKGKRQHCMALRVIGVASPNSQYREEAGQVLIEIQKGW